MTWKTTLAAAAIIGLMGLVAALPLILALAAGGQP